MVERLMPEQIVNVVWSLNMDLCAILYANNSVDVVNLALWEDLSNQLQSIQGVLTHRA